MSSARRQLSVEQGEKISAFWVRTARGKTLPEDADYASSHRQRIGGHRGHQREKETREVRKLSLCQPLGGADLPATGRENLTLAAEYTA